MAVYRLRSDPERFRWLTMMDQTAFDVEDAIEGRPFGARWPTPAVTGLIEDDADARKPLGDFPTLGSMPTFSRRAVDALLDVLAENGELLPLSGDAGEFYVYNVTRVVDALDEDASELVRFQSSGRVMHISRFAFRPEAVQGLTVFKIPQMLRVLVLVTDRFVQRVAQAGLTGFEFEEVWPGAAGVRS